MAISSVNYNLSASWGAYNQKLTKATKEKLDSLGISYTDNMTEAEGKKLIQTAQQTEKSSSQNSSFLNQQNSSNNLFEQAKALAEKLGIRVEENIEFKALLTRIETKLEELVNANQDNIGMLEKLKGYSQELANIQAESTGSSGYDDTNQALMKSLEILAYYNRNYFNN